MRWTQHDVDEFLARQRTPVGRARVDSGSKPIASPAAPQKATGPSAKSTKYRNRKVTDAEGNVHDSTREYHRWQALQLRELAGEIRSLRRQVPYALAVNGVLVCQYVADFVYVEGAATIVEDCKSPPTRKLAAYRIKAKLMQAIHGIQIREV